MAGLSHRERYEYAEVDGRRTLGRVEDLICVEAWDVKFFRRQPCTPLPVPADPRTLR